jgi:hypothetical protein
MKNEIKKEEGETEVEMLARIVINRFDKMDARFDKMDARIDTLESGMKAGFDEVNTHLAVIENIKFRGLENRLERQEDKMLQAQVFLKTKFA